MTIDDRLSALAGSPVHPGLESMEIDVFARIDSNLAAVRQARLGLVAAIGSATLAGVASAAVPAADRSDVAIDVVSIPLAPSTLLGGR